MAIIEDHDHLDRVATMPILYLPLRMLTRNRLVPLLAITSQFEMQIGIDHETDEVSVCISIDNEVFERATDFQLMEVANLFRGLEVGFYHPKIAELLNDL